MSGQSVREDPSRADCQPMAMVILGRIATSKRLNMMVIPALCPKDGRAEA